MRPLPLPLLLAAVLLYGCATPPPSPTPVDLDPATTFQTIDGWGGHVYPQALPYFERDSTFADRWLDTLQSTHIRVRSFWYLLEAENDNDDPAQTDFDRLAAADTGLVHDELVLQKRLAERGAKLMFAAWRFPYWMVNEPPDWRPQYEDTPALPDDMDAEFVESITAYLLYARDRYGVTFDAVSVANEPDLGIYISGLSPERLLRLYERLRARLEAADYPTRYYPPDVAAADSLGETYTEQFFALGGAVELADALSYHTYRRELPVVEAFGDLGERLQLPVWAMEQNDTHLAAPDRHEWSHALKNAICLHDILAYGNVSLSIHFSYAMANSGGLAIYLPETDTFTPTYHLLRHFYNHIPAGAVRIAATPDSTADGLRAVAFQQPEGGPLTAVLINAADTPQSVALTVGGETVSLEAIYLSDPQRRYEPNVPAEDAALTLPPRSVLTAILAPPTP